MDEKKIIPLEEIQKIILSENREQAIIDIAQKYATTFVTILAQLKELLGDEEYQIYVGNVNPKIPEKTIPIIQFDPVKFYSKYIDKITCAFLENVFQDKDGNYRCNAKRSSEKEKYMFKGLSDNVVLIECPKDILALEFEVHNNKTKEDYKEVSKDKVKEWVNETVNKIKGKGFDYCVCDHGGTSPWIYLCNMTGLVEKYEKESKVRLVKEIVPFEAFDFVDLSNFGATLIPIIGRPHWKSKKYNNAIHQIVEGKTPDTHSNLFPEELSQEIMGIYKPQERISYEKYDSESNINDISMTSIVNMSGLKKRGHEYQGSNPWHSSTTGMNFTLDPFKNVGFCFRCNVGVNPAQAIALNEGIISSCDSKMSRDQFFQVLEIAMQKYGLKRRTLPVIITESPSSMLEPQKELIDFDSIRQEIHEININREIPSPEKKKRICELISRELQKGYYVYSIKEDKGSEVWIYKEGVYIPNGKSELKQIMRHILQSLYSEVYIKDILARIEADTFIDANDFFNRKYLEYIPIQNGLLNILTLKLIPHDPHMIFFNKLPVSYDPDAKCPAIDKHLETVLKHPEDKELFYEIAGYCLWKDYPIERAIMMVGNGRNGKSKSIELIKRFLGLSNCASVSLIAMNDGSFSMANLFGKMVNLAGDLSSLSIKETGFFKQTTSRDLISAHRKYLTDLQFMNYAKHIFACNELPMVFDNSKGFWERWIIFEFPYTFVPQKEYDSLKPEEKDTKKLMDIDLIEKISTQEELNGMLIKALNGLHNLLERKDFCKTQGSESVKQFWVRRANSFMAFCMDYLEENYEIKVTKIDMRKAFSEYCRLHKLKGSSDQMIKKTLQEEFGASEEFEPLFQDSDRKHVWKGIAFKKDSIYFKFNYPSWKENFS